MKAAIDIPCPHGLPLCRHLAYEVDRVLLTSFGMGVSAKHMIENTAFSAEKAREFIDKAKAYHLMVEENGALCPTLLGYWYGKLSLN